MYLRLDQFIANCTELSRKEAKRAIASGSVAVNGSVCKTANQKIPDAARVALNGRPLTLPGEHYLMMNKPEGVVSATRDSEHPTALDLLPAELARDLHIAGRLDLDTTGLLLLTTDGQWSHRITSPRTDCPKTYRVHLDAVLTEAAGQALEAGLLLRNEETRTRPATVRRLGDKVIELTISEGRYHQVKRMLAAVGNHVVTLHRIRVGNILLDPELAPGDYRALTQQEIESVRSG